MLFRAIALSVALLVGIGGVVVPMGTVTVEAGQYKASKNKRYKKYSKKWWRQYRSRQKKRRAMVARKRAVRLGQLRLAQANGQDLVTAAKAITPRTTEKPPKAVTKLKPRTVIPAIAASTDVGVRLDDGAGWQVGNAEIKIIGPAVGESSMAKHAKSVGGVSTSSLRTDVINQMIRENGWVVNDYQKEIGGRAVYVVVAQSQGAGGRVQSRMFYFTEVDGRIYNVATNSPVEQQDRLALESDKVLDGLHIRLRNTQRAATKD